MTDGVNIASISKDVSLGDNMTNLALKYRPKEFEDVTEQAGVVTILKAMCEQDALPNRNFLLVGPRGCGKAQPLTSKVLTVDGYKKMSDIKKRTKVITSRGNIAKVKKVFPQGERLVYTLTFDDGTSIDVADNHLNELIECHGTSKREVVVTTIELLNSLLRQVLSRDNEFHYEVRLPKIDLDLYEYPATPEEFALSSEIRRKTLIKQMFVDCGYVVDWSNYTLMYKNSREFESYDLIFRSLGCKVEIDEEDSEKRIVHLTHDIATMFTDSDLAYFDPPTKTLLNVKVKGKEKCQCILVDHEDHSYISDYFIPTHNTTLGRIMGRKLNGGDGQTIELDAASHSGVDTVRDIIAQARQYPIASKYKIFICDECHMFSQAAWASLLVTLESQPAKSIFILLTTNPEKIPTTILSRVQKFQLSNISLEGIENRLKYVIDAENKDGAGITYTDDAISYIAKLAKGGMRDSLTLLDKALVYSQNLTAESLKFSLDIPEYDDYFTLLNAYAKRDTYTIMMTVSRIYNSGTNFVKWFEEFQSFVINIAKYVFVKDISMTMIPSYYEEKLENYNVTHAKVCLKLSQILVEIIAKISRTEYMEEVAISYLCGGRVE